MFALSNPVSVHTKTKLYSWLEFVSNVMVHAQKPDFVFRRNGRVHLNRRGRQFSRLLAAEVCTSAVVMLDTPSSEVVWSGLATHSIRQFPLHFPCRASPCAITFQTHSTYEPYHEGFWGTGGKIQHILNFMTIRERVVSFTPRRLYLRKTYSDILRVETWAGSAMEVDYLE